MWGLLILVCWWQRFRDGTLISLSISICVPCKVILYFIVLFFIICVFVFVIVDGEGRGGGHYMWVIPTQMPAGGGWDLLENNLSLSRFSRLMVYVFCNFTFLILVYFKFLRSRGERCLGLSTLRAVSTLGSLRVPCIVNWSLPPSGRMKSKVIELYVQWQHSGETVCTRILRLRASIIFPICRQKCKANGVVNVALFANWCLIEYISCLVEISAVFSGFSLLTCIQIMQLIKRFIFSTK